MSFNIFKPKISAFRNNVPNYIYIHCTVQEILIIIWKYYVSGHYPSPCVYLKTPSSFNNPSESTVLFTLQKTTFRRLDPLSVVRVQLSRFHLKETESSLRNIVFCNIKRTVFLDKDRTMVNVHKYNFCTNILWRGA
jgi:hypothetical protein